MRTTRTRFFFSFADSECQQKLVAGGAGCCGIALVQVEYARVPSTLVGGSPKARKTKAPETLLLTEAVRFFLKQEKG
ncbi:hypothetical protein OZO98_001738 [Salmonella enterica]|nr:hypothetical protein [Salmonella enterica]